MHAYITYNSTRLDLNYQCFSQIIYHDAWHCQWGAYFKKQRCMTCKNAPLFHFQRPRHCLTPCNQKQTKALKFICTCTQWQISKKIQICRMSTFDWTRRIKNISVTKTTWWSKVPSALISNSAHWTTYKSNEINFKAVRQSTPFFLAHHSVMDHLNRLMAYWFLTACHMTGIHINPHMKNEHCAVK